MAPILGIWASSKAVATDTGAMFPLQVITVGPAGASSVSFTNIPSTYSHLQLRIIGRSASSNYGFLRFNSDSGSNYASHFLYGDGSSAAASAVTSSTSIYGARMGAATSTFGASIVDILDYANTNKNKTVRTLMGNDENGSGLVLLVSGLWTSTSAISSITYIPQVSDFLQNSQFALYGIKGA